jgi:hypothetical protein
MRLFLPSAVNREIKGVKTALLPSWEKAGTARVTAATRTPSPPKKVKDLRL